MILLAYFHRAPMLKTQVDPVLTMVVGYLCLAPTGACCSWDAWRQRKNEVEGNDDVQLEIHTSAAPTPSIAANLAQRLIQIHVVGIYLISVFGKLGGIVWWEGSAIWWMGTQADSPLVSVASWIKFPELIYATTHLVVFSELIYPWLIWNRWARPLVMLLSSFVWIGLAAITGRVSFCLLMVGLQIAFFEGYSPFPSNSAAPNDELS
jgi:hypothetical protein